MFPMGGCCLPRAQQVISRAPVAHGLMFVAFLSSRSAGETAILPPCEFSCLGLGEEGQNLLRIFVEY